METYLKQLYDDEQKEQKEQKEETKQKVKGSIDIKLPGQTHKTDNAFVLTHFGNNPLFFEATLYFVFNLTQHTHNNIVWLYSVIDTPSIFVEIMSTLVFLVKPYNEDNITAINTGNGTVGSIITQANPFKYGVSMIRVCNWIFAYKLTQYTKLCLI